jgi:hypothetical protein
MAWRYQATFPPPNQIVTQNAAPKSLGSCHASMSLVKTSFSILTQPMAKTLLVSGFSGLIGSEVWVWFARELG